MNWPDLINVIANTLLGITAVIALWFSIKALKKSEWDSAMNTTPSLVLRPRKIWVGTRGSEIEHGYGVVEEGYSIRSTHKPFEIVFTIEFECFNAGRGVAFNISQPKSDGMPISGFRTYRVPLYQTLDDEPFQVELQLRKSFDEWFLCSNDELPVRLDITYTNDQNNIFCRSSWTAKVKPFDLNEGNLNVREIRLLGRRGRIEYSDKIYEN